MAGPDWQALLSGITERAREKWFEDCLVTFHCRSAISRAPQEGEIANKWAFNATSTRMVAAIKMIIQFLIVARHYLRLIITQVKRFAAKLKICVLFDLTATGAREYLFGDVITVISINNSFFRIKNFPGQITLRRRSLDSLNPAGDKHFLLWLVPTLIASLGPTPQSHQQEAGRVTIFV